MKISTIVAVVVGIGIAGGAWYWLSRGQSVPLSPPAPADHKSATYTIEGKSVALIGGRAEEVAAPGSATKVVTQYFGNEAEGDLSGDGVADIAFILTQDPGGSGTFYYAVAAIKTADGYRGTDAVLLGDRVAPQTTEIKDGILIVNYADRNAGEPMTTAPSLGKSLYLKLDPATLQLGIVVQGFEGEADPSRMTLGMKTWSWVKTQYNDDTSVVPKKPEKFTLTFKNDGTFSATTDCNGVGGGYTVTGNKIVFSKMMSTLMYCEGSQESDFTKGLVAAQSFFFTSKGELIIDLKFDTGTMTFR